MWTIFLHLLLETDRHLTWSLEPREGSAAWSAKILPSFFSYFKTLSNGPTPGIEPATSRSAVMRSTDWANPACSFRDSKQCKTSKYVHRNTPLQDWRVSAAWCSQINHYTVVLSYRFRPVYMTKSSPEKEGHPPAESTEKIVDFFAQANSVRTYFDCLALTKLTQLGELKCLYKETLDQLGEWPYIHKRVNRRLGGLPFSPSQLFFTFTRFATLFNPLHVNHKIKIWILIS